MRSLALLFSATLAFATTQLHAQAPAAPTAPLVKVDIKKVYTIEQQSPQFSAGAVKDKRWRPKNWIEVDVEFEIKLPATVGGNKGTLAALQMNLYLALQHMTKDGKREILVGNFDLMNIPAGEPCHVLAYVSPATLKSIFQKDNVTASTDVQGWGVEVFSEGTRIAGDSSLGKEPWWEISKDKLAIIPGLLVHKSQTPFGILWSDYDLAVKPK